MPWWTLAAVVFLGVVLVSAMLLGVVWFARLRGLQRTGVGLAAAAEALGAKAERLESRMAATQARVDAAEKQIESLRRSLDRFSVLTWALGDTRRTLSLLRTAGRK